MDFLIFIFYALIPYLIGSILPGYFLAKLKGKDIFKEGYGLPGASNVKLVLGTHYAIVTALFDLTKPILSLLVLLLLNKYFNLDTKTVLIFPVFAILGHIFPFYLKFRGGRGLGALYGYTLFILLLNLFLDPKLSLPLFLTLILSFGTFLTFKRLPYPHTTQLAVIGATYWLLLYQILFLKTELGIYGFFFLNLILITTMMFNFIEAKERGLLTTDESKEVIWRKFLRPLGLVLSIGYIYFPIPILILILFLFLIFLILEILKFAEIKGVIKTVYRKKEKTQISSIINFFLSTILIFTLFRNFPIIASLSISFLLIGDLFAFLIGSIYRRKILFHTKSLEGTLSNFAGCFLISLIYTQIFGLNPLISIPGAIFSSIFELLSIKIDDNFTVPIGSCLVMFLLNQVFL